MVIFGECWGVRVTMPWAKGRGDKVVVYHKTGFGLLGRV